MPNTHFNPTVHGFHFSNNNIKWSVKQFPLISGSALCGGMVYAALDYFLSRMSIPADRTAPKVGTALNDYLFDRQLTAHKNTGFKFIGARLLPTINHESEHAKLKSILRGGNPVPLCMVSDTNVNSVGHHLLAIGCNDTGPMSISAYDPNAPDRVANIHEHVTGGFHNTMSQQLFPDIFVDDGYDQKRPPLVTGLLAGQRNWRLCRTCQGLFFAGNNSLGICPANPKGHDGSQSRNYVLSHNQGNGQANWSWCLKCQGLYFAGHPGSAGICPDGGIHNGRRSGNYILALGVGAGQENWRWCQMCEGLFFAGNDSPGVCPANPKGHDISESGNYFLPNI